ncbi:hypothetical protein VNO80_32651 [Phaseolus coccineus]|uniref:Uncharacterized protein n=1 Tax=Phaseolus coccineus TaxID=3886 RepID=A0AAN9L2S8_PHACN
MKTYRIKVIKSKNKKKILRIRKGGSSISGNCNGFFISSCSKKQDFLDTAVSREKYSRDFCESWKEFDEVPLKIYISVAPIDENYFRNKSKINKEKQSKILGFLIPQLEFLIIKRGGNEYIEKTIKRSTDIFYNRISKNKQYLFSLDHFFRFIGVIVGCNFQLSRYGSFPFF